MGSVFSPWYAWSGRRDPADHTAINVALYGSGPRRWTMTERGRPALSRSTNRLAIGPSTLDWDGAALNITLDEISAPLPRPVRGHIRLWPRAIGSRAFDLDAHGRHRWWPIAPHARVEISLDQPGLSWSGEGYLDTNAGDEPLEDGFVTWDWARSGGPDGARIRYDVTRRDGVRHTLALDIAADGRVEEQVAPPRVSLPGTRIWRIPRGMNVDGQADLVATLEDTPFYARSLVKAEDGPLWFHESLMLDRFRSAWVRTLLPFRMPRRRG